MSVTTTVLGWERLYGGVSVCVYDCGYVAESLCAVVCVCIYAGLGELSTCMVMATFIFV